MTPATQPSSRDRTRQVITLIAIISTFLINLWSNLFPINGENIGQLANTLFADVLFIPANYAFTIWGLIYIALFVFGFYQLRSNQADNPRFRRGGYWLVGACIAQNIWVFLFLLRQFALSTLAMFAILVCLAVYYVALDVGSPAVPKHERWRAQIPISIYLGWISVATIVNVALALYSFNWNGWGIDPVWWTVIMLVIAALLGIWILLQRTDLAFALVLVWAFVAIAIKHFSQPLIAGAAFSLSLALILFALWQQPKRRSSTSQPE